MTPTAVYAGNIRFGQLVAGVLAGGQVPGSPGQGVVERFAGQTIGCRPGRDRRQGLLHAPAVKVTHGDEGSIALAFTTLATDDEGNIGAGAGRKRVEAACATAFRAETRAIRIQCLTALVIPEARARRLRARNTCAALGVGRVAAGDRNRLSRGRRRAVVAQMSLVDSEHGVATHQRD